VTATKPHLNRALLNRGLSRKFLLILMVGVSVTTVCTGVFGYYHAIKLRRAGADAIVQQDAEMLAREIDMSLASAVGLLKQLAASPRLQQAIAEKNMQYEGLNDEEIERLSLKETTIWKAANQPEEELHALRNSRTAGVLAAFAETNPGFQTLIAVDRERRALAAFGELNSPYPREEKKWDKVRITGLARATISEPVFAASRVSPSVLISVPISPDGTGGFEGELYAEYGLNRIVSAGGGDDQEIVAFLLTDTGKRHLFILHPSHMASPRATGFRKRGDELSDAKGGRFSLELDQFGITALAGFAPVGSSHPLASAKYSGRKWFVVTAMPYSHIIAPVNSLFFQALGFAAGMLILISLAGLALARRILHPIHMLQEGVQEIGQGNLEHRIDVRSGDEIETLAYEFNRMADRMQRTQEQLQRRGKELEQRVNQLRRLQAQLMQSERMAATGELAAQIAHEINNPLGIIKNYVGIAKMLMPEDDSNRENLKIVDQEINRTAGIVRRLLKFAKPSTEDIQSVQINQLLEELLALLRGQLFRNKIEVSVELADNLPEVSTSTDQMRQVFLNLIKNAEDSMSDGGKLIVRTQYRKGHVEIVIADTGCGIPPEDVKNIFEPFFTTKGVKGTGLGLSVSYGIVKNYSGEITVESEPGTGTTFTIQLPVVHDKVFQVIRSS